jgi:hypothetical protein
MHGELTATRLVICYGYSPRQTALRPAPPTPAQLSRQLKPTTATPGRAGRSVGKEVIDQLLLPCMHRHRPLQV